MQSGISGSSRDHAGPLVLISTWRLVLAATALTGFAAALTGDFERGFIPFNLNYFSQLGALAVGLTALGGLLSPLWNDGRIEGARGFLRGASTTWSVLIMIVFATLLHGSYSSLSSKLEHLVVPVLAAIDWIVVGRNSSRLQWWWPLVWLAGPVVYLPFYIAATHQRGRPLYGFLDPDSGDFWIVAAGVLLGFAVLGYLLWAIGRLSGRMVSSRTGPHAG